MSRSTLFAPLTLIALATMLTISRAHAQEDTRPGVGLSASLQTTQFDILLPIWVGDRFSIAPAFGAVWGQGQGSDIHLAVMPRFYLYRERVAPYIGARIGVLLASPENGESTADILTGGAFGGEYFVDRHISVGVESQINITLSADKSSRFGNPGKMNINTGVALFATLYF